MLSSNHFCRGNANSITHSECVFVASFIRHAVRMRRVVFSFVAYPAYSIFTHCLKNRRFSKIKKFLNIKCMY